MAKGTKVTKFEQGVAHKVAFCIDGDVFPVTVAYTGRGIDYDGIRLGEFKNVNRDNKFYLLSLEQLSNMQGEEFTSDVFGE